MPALWAAKVSISDPAYDDYDGIPLVEAFARDGKSAEALEALSRLSSRQRLSVDARIVEVELLAESGQGTNALARIHDLVSGAGLAPAQVVRLRRLEARLLKAQNRFDACWSALASVRKFWASEDRLFAARCARDLKRADLAWTAVVELPPSPQTSYERTETLLDLGLHRQAESRALEDFARQRLAPIEALRVIEAFSRRSLLNETMRLLEAQKLKHPLDLDINLAWSQAAYRIGLSNFAAEGFAVASLQEPKHAYTAAELFRIQGDHLRAQFFQFFVRDDAERLRHQIAMALDGGRYDIIATLEPALARSNLRRDDEVAYALGYSLMKAGRYANARRWLKPIRSRSFAVKAATLMMLSESCATDSSVLACRF